MKTRIISIVLTAMIFSPSCEVLQNIEIQGYETLSEGDIIRGLKQALEIGTQNGINTLSREDGFYGNTLLRIPFPPEVKIVEDKLRAIGLNKMVDDFIMTMNRGAEKAVKKASPIFIEAIKSMTFSDARNILNGPGNAATEYFRTKTSAQLVSAFKPDVKQTLDQVQVTAYWKDLTTAYNKIPFTFDVETDLPQYVTEKAVEGLFTKIEEEEKLIREDPAARVTDLLKKVFK